MKTPTIAQTTLKDQHEHGSIYEPKHVHEIQLIILINWELCMTLEFYNFTLHTLIKRTAVPMSSAPSVLTNFNQIRNISADFFRKIAQYQNSHGKPWQMRKGGQTDGRDEANRRFFFSRNYAFPLPTNISPMTNFMKIPPSGSPGCYERTDGRTCTANFSNSSSRTLRYI
jgi:hypothetical protein